MTSITGFVAVTATASTDNVPTHDYVRIHIRANSNQDADQQVKYLVKEDVVAYLSPILSTCDTIEQAYATVQNELDNLADLCTNSLHKKGYTYTAKARFCQEYFPTRVYGDTTLPDGTYQALIIELGTGTGDNWWCVLYPPLCFVGGKNISYRSMIYDFLHKLI